MDKVSHSDMRLLDEQNSSDSTKSDDSKGAADGAGSAGKRSAGGFRDATDFVLELYAGRGRREGCLR